MTDGTREAIAWHEAGHAVTAMQFGLHVGYVTIRPADICSFHAVVGCLSVESSTSLGHVMVGRPGNDVDLEPWILMVMAGPVAEQRQCGAIEDAHDAADLDEVRFLVRGELFCTLRRFPTVGELDDVVATYRDKSAAVVDRCWPWIERVASALQQRVGLLPDEIEALQ